MDHRASATLVAFTVLFLALLGMHLSLKWQIEELSDAMDAHVEACHDLSELF